MTEESRRTSDEGTGNRSLASGVVYAAVLVLALQFVPAVSAHGGTVAIVQWASLIPLVLGLVLIACCVAVPRLSDRGVSKVLVTGVAVGVVLVAAGAVGLVQLSQLQSFSVEQSPLSEGWYQLLALLSGASVIALSVLLGRLFRPKEPRFAGLGVLLGVWIAYPALLTRLGLDSFTNPLGYAIVLALPLATAYILARDCRGLLAALWSDRLARRFGVVMAVVAALFFLFSSGMFSFAIDRGVGISWSHTQFSVVQFVDPLVYWPAVELFVPRLPFVTPVLSGVLPAGFFPTPPTVPFRAALSVGVVLMTTVVSVLVGLNAALVVHLWQGDNGTDAASASATGSAVALAAPNVCCCCGPALAEFAVVLLGPSSAMSFYWLFIDFSSPVGALFFALTVGVLVYNLVRAGPVRGVHTTDVGASRDVPSEIRDTNS